MNWFRSQNIHVSIIPDSSAKRFSGLSGGVLKLTDLSGTTLGTVINKFNTYRAPDQQIKRVFSQNGNVLSLDTVLKNDITVIVKEDSF
jgi:hypothetical protein